LSSIARQKDHGVGDFAGFAEAADGGDTTNIWRRSLPFSTLRRMPETRGVSMNPGWMELTLISRAAIQGRRLGEHEDSAL
jgi:hypothetical protein